MIIEKVKNFISYNQAILVFSLLALLSIFSFVYYFIHGDILLFGDANSRLNIARGIIDNLTPGLGQLSNVWLPLPTFLMLPFIWNNYLWHSGIAGAIISMASYILGGIFLYKSAKILSNSSFASFGATLVYALNINLLYLQTTAMSEPIFITSLIIAIYHFMIWIKDYKKIINLIYAGIAIAAASLIRYEAWAVMLSSIPAVVFYLWIKTKSYKETEGKTILYATIATFGFIVWSIYLTALYGDPLYWKDEYLTPSFKSSPSSTVETFRFNYTVLQAGWEYFTTVVWMNGIIPSIFALFSIPLLILNSIKKKTFYFLPFLMLLSIFAFMILTLQRNTPINQPVLSLSNILSASTLKISEFNMRYGLTMLPFIALISTYLFRIRFVLVRMLLILLLGIQIYSYINPVYSVIYQLPIGNNIEMIPAASAVNGDDMVKWFKKHYDGGLIMISAKVHNPEMLELGYDFKTYIHEGTGKYWNTSIRQPQIYASWIILDQKDSDDAVTEYLGSSPKLKEYYNLVYNKDGLKVYKIKTQPEIIIK